MTEEEGRDPANGRTVIEFPDKDSWALGDRSVTCFIDLPAHEPVRLVPASGATDPASQPQRALSFSVVKAVARSSGPISASNAVGSRR